MEADSYVDRATREHGQRITSGDIIIAATKGSSAGSADEVRLGDLESVRHFFDIVLHVDTSLHTRLGTLLPEANVLISATGSMDGWLQMCFEVTMLARCGGKVDEYAVTKVERATRTAQRRSAELARLAEIDNLKEYVLAAPPPKNSYPITLFNYSIALHDHRQCCKQCRISERGYSHNDQLSYMFVRRVYYQTFCLHVHRMFFIKTRTFCVSYTT